MTKSQIAGLLGRAQFQEGFFGVQEWDDVLNVTNDAGAPQMVCQLKAVFTSSDEARNFYRKCGDNAETLTEGKWQKYPVAHALAQADAQSRGDGCHAAESRSCPPLGQREEVTKYSRKLRYARAWSIRPVSRIPLLLYRCIDSHTLYKRLTDIGMGVRSSCANSDTRSSSSNHRYSLKRASATPPRCAIAR